MGVSKEKGVQKAMVCGGWKDVSAATSYEVRMPLTVGMLCVPYSSAALLFALEFLLFAPKMSMLG